MSFIDLMADDVWTEHDIINRTESILYGAFSREREQILNRKMVAFSLGRLIPNAAEQADLIAYEQAAYAAQAAGYYARQDMALLNAAMAYERAEARLLRAEEPVTLDSVDEEGNAIEIDNPAYAQDAAERSEAEGVLLNATDAVISLVQARKARYPAPLGATPYQEPQTPSEPPTEASEAPTQPSEG